MTDKCFQEIEEKLKQWTRDQKSKGLAQENFVEAAVRFMMEEIGLTENDVRDFFARTYSPILAAKFKLMLEDPNF